MNDKIGVFGRSAFKYILGKEHPKEIWLPDYICESLVEQADILNIPIKWYHINNDFSIDFSTIKNPKCILYIYYFGLTWTPPQLKHSISILDTTHSPDSLFPHMKYCFSSLRKYYKLEDGVIINRKTNITCYSKKIYEKIDPYIESSQRKDKYFYIYKRVPNNLGCLGMLSFMYPLLLKKRDYIRGKLIEKGFNCPIHWRESRQKYLAEHELSIPLTYNKEDLDKIIKIVKRYA